MEIVDMSSGYLELSSKDFTICLYNGKRFKEDFVIELKPKAGGIIGWVMETDLCIVGIDGDIEGKVFTAMMGNMIVLKPSDVPMEYKDATILKETDHETSSLVIGDEEFIMDITMMRTMGFSI